MASSTHTLKWSTQLRVAQQSRRLMGDKVTLPQSALEALLAAAPVVPVENGQSRNLTSTFDPFNPYSYAAERQAREQFADRQQQLPHPLTFKLVNPQNGRVVYAGIREFSADEDEIVLSSFLREALGLRDQDEKARESTPGEDKAISNGSAKESPKITIHAHQLPKGTYVRFRPLEPGYDPEDWKSLLERYLRDNFTTLTKGELLNVPGMRHETFRFLVDKFEPEGDGVCIVDTDLEVDIEALNEEQARETLSRRLQKAKRAPGTDQGSSQGGILYLDKEEQGQVLPGEYVDYELRSWDRALNLEIVLEADDSNSSLDLFFSPFSARQRSQPREDENTFGDYTSRATKRLKLSHTNVEVESAEAIRFSVHGWRSNSPDSTLVDRPIPYSLKISSGTSTSALESTQLDLNSDEIICKNCRQHIPKRTLPLHEAFCYRNNVSCPQCSNVFLKSSDAWKNHWHCLHDDEYGNDDKSHIKHDSISHPPSPLQCPNCDYLAFNLPILAQHRTSTCPGKEILCQFCHLVVPQQGPDDPPFTDAEVILSGLTPHELADGARTTNCHLCNKIVRLRDMNTHLRIHDRERVSRPRPTLCDNEICGRTIKSGDEARVRKEQFGLCNECFGPLYGTAYDPEGKALKRRVERRLLQQVMGGCGKLWCRNSDWCRTAHKNVSGEDRVITAKDALPLIRPVMAALGNGDTFGLRFCVDEASQARRSLGQVLSANGSYEIQWCIKALEEEKGDFSMAEQWLAGHAPKIGEVVR